MAKPFEPYREVMVESYKPPCSTGLHGKIHIRPVEGQGYTKDLHVECSKRLSAEYPVGTRFILRAKLTDREDGGEYLYSYHRWPVTVLET
jgi:hypothetical protein